jgi:hypothetical protein
VHPGVVTFLNVVDFEHTVLIDIDLLKSLDANVCAHLVHWPDDAPNEFVKVDFVVAVYIENLEESRDIFGVDFDTEVVDCLGELVLVKSA